MAVSLSFVWALGLLLLFAAVAPPVAIQIATMSAVLEALVTEPNAVHQLRFGRNNGARFAR
jgi:hypothetical protein